MTSVTFGWRLAPGFERIYNLTVAGGTFWSCIGEIDSSYWRRGVHKSIEIFCVKGNTPVEISPVVSPSEAWFHHVWRYNPIILYQRSDKGRQGVAGGRKKSVDDLSFLAFAIDHISTFIILSTFIIDSGKISYAARVNRF